ncbi:hypothetical protein K4L44_01835 [Halosquirtibacter laminarini]|uniref:Uncharacterized protein n=1 Tax=Halosquirtibacter laminarini TaxID=3374600 RepID=A0AC61NG82_9BACT|nr:hypothetical protein K4L44_01835 [Prolixibacteraceae bacterium]
MKSITICLIIILLPLITLANYIGLETNIPSNWTTNTGTGLALSNRHFKLGNQSVEWTWNNGDQILISNPQNINTALNAYKGGLMMWIYNEVPVDDEIIVEFGKGTSVSFWFNYNINFKGWRACWIRFDQDMKGDKSATSLDYMRIKAPTNVANGKLYFDRMMFPSTRINDRVTPDAQLPYINPDMNNNHWGALYYWENSTSSTLPKKESLSAEDVNQLETFTQNIYNSLSKYISDKTIQQSIDFYNSLNIQRVDGQIIGNPYVSNDEADLDKNDNDAKMKDINKHLYNIAKGAKRNNSESLLEKYINMMDWAIDQGFDYNSGMGTNHHYGYNFDGFCESILLLKDELQDKGLLEKYAKAGTYWSGIQEYKQTPINDEFQGVVDSWNTVTTPRLISIAIKPNTVDKYQNLMEMKRWMDESLKYSNGTIGGIKVDGSVYHHGVLYPAYAVGGFNGLSNYLKLTQNTVFTLAKSSRVHLWEGLKAMIRYTQKRHWGLGISGRHPLEDGGKISSGTIRCMGYLALTPDPKTDANIWEEVASQYLRYETGTTDIKTRITNAGITKGEAYTGAYTYNYSAFGIYRQKDWLVSIKGYNYYTWGSEIYETDNRYGRYQSYGTVQVLTGENATNENNGFQENGWDWNRAPGATSIHLPWDLLDSPQDGDHMGSGSHSQRGQVKFTGYGNLDNKYGLFGMLLREDDFYNSTPTHRANKSVFAFDKYIICNGTNISNDNATYRTETTLFQYKINKSAASIIVDGVEITSFPYSQDFNDDNAHWIIDPNGNGYWINGGQKVEIRKQHQTSKSNNHKNDTEGDFAVAVINHGVAPANEYYRYMIVPNTTIAEMQELANTINGTNKIFQIEKETEKYHVFKAKEGSIKGYCFFDVSDIDDNLISSVNNQCLIITERKSDNSIKISLTDPDLKIDGTFPLTAEPSQVSNTQLTLNGSYSLIGESPNVNIVSKNQYTTVLNIAAIHGKRTQFSVRKSESKVLISESFETPASASTYTIDGAYDLSKNEYFGRYKLSSIDKYYTSSKYISTIDQDYFIAGEIIQTTTNEATSINFAPVTKTVPIQAIHCSFLLGTLVNPANKFESLDFVRLEYQDIDGIYKPIGQMVGSVYSKDGATTNPSYGKLGTDTDSNNDIDGVETTEYSENGTLKLFEFEKNNIDISTLKFRIKIKTDKKYEAIYIDKVVVYEMKEAINTESFSQSSNKVNVDFSVSETGTLHYVISKNKIDNISSREILLGSNYEFKSHFEVQEGTSYSITETLNSDEKRYIYMFIEDSEEHRSKVHSIDAQSTDINDISSAQIKAYVSNNLICIEGLENTETYSVEIFDLLGKKQTNKIISHQSNAFININDQNKTFIILRVTNKNEKISFKLRIQ